MLKILVAGQMENLPHNLKIHSDIHKSRWMFSENIIHALQLFDLHDPEIVVINLSFDMGQGVDLLLCIQNYCAKNFITRPEIWITSHFELDEEIIDYLENSGANRIFDKNTKIPNHTVNPNQFLEGCFA